MRGQAAVEYLMTYGWAILALIIVVGVLLSSGILSPNYLVSEECTFGTNLKCQFALFNEGGSTKIILEIFNGFPYEVELSNVYLQTADGKEYFQDFPQDVMIRSGESATYNGRFTGQMLGEGNVKRFTGNITYVSCAPELGAGCQGAEHVISGRVVGKVIPK